MRPYLVIVCDNGSTDGTPEVARKFLSEAGVDYVIARVRRFPEAGKFNINVVYHVCASESLKHEVDFVATIEADTLLEHRYFEKVIGAFNEDGRIGVASGRVLTVGGREIVVDPFPLPRNYVNLPGSARVYRYECWRELNTYFNFLHLPTWDTDHTVLATLLGWRVARIEDAVAYTRPDKPFKGFYKGVTDAMHDLPITWALYKSFNKRDFSYLIGYLKCRLINCQNAIPRYLRTMYKSAAMESLLRRTKSFLNF